jgi:hypothetical protein
MSITERTSHLQTTAIGAIEMKLRLHSRPASTMQVVNPFIKAKKIFDLIVLPGQGHSPGGEYGERKRFDFFVHDLLGVEPPDWNTIDATKAGSATSSLN